MSKIPAALFVGILALVVAGGLFAYFKGASNAKEGTTLRGNVIFGVTDQAASLSAVESIKLTVDKVRVHREDDGWFTASEGEREFSLLDLKERAVVELLAQAQLEAGDYDQIRIEINKVVITKTNGQIIEAKLPSGDLKLTGRLLVQGDKTSSVVIDFLADESLHLTGNGKLIFTPVVKLEIRSGAQVEVSGKNVVVSGGTMETQAHIGMNENGEMKEGFALNANAKLEVLQNNVIRVIPEGQTESDISIGAETALQIAKEGNYVATPLSVTLTRIDGKKIWQVSGVKNLALSHVFVDASTGAVIATE